MNEELERMICGDYLGAGIHRKVFVYAIDPDYVIKVAHEGYHGRAMNILEYEIWRRISDEPVRRWFAEVKYLSQAGKYIIQRRVTQIPEDKYPDKVPNFFTDLQFRNFGRIGRRFVCSDYGSVMLDKALGLGSQKMVRANWWKE